MDNGQDIRVLLADDDAGMRLILRKKIEKTEGFCVAGEAKDGEETMKCFHETRPQVVFLDVDMPGMSGIDCARQIQDLNPACILIFATGHEEYMSDAFEVYAFDYLVKPFKLERLENTLLRIRTLYESMEEKKKKVPEKPKKSFSMGRMLLHHRDGVSFVDFKDIVLIQREERTTVLYTDDHERYVLSETLSEMEEKLDPEMFFRCHKSYIVNVQRIRNMTPYGRWTYVMQLDGTEHDALITHEKYDELEKRFS